MSRKYNVAWEVIIDGTSHLMFPKCTNYFVLQITVGGNIRLGGSKILTDDDFEQLIIDNVKQFPQAFN